MNCVCDERFAKWVEKWPGKQIPDTCASCGRRTREKTGAAALKLCSRCKAIKYCSRECQKHHWPDHKSTCEVDQGKGSMKSLIRSLVYGHPLLHNFISICAWILHGFDRDMSDTERQCLTQSQLYMQMDVGIEPTDINELIRLCQDPKSYDHRGVEGMLQIHHLSVTNPVKLELPGARAVAEEARVGLNAEGEADSPLVILTAVDCSQVVMQFSLILFSGLMRPLDAHNAFFGETVQDGTIASPRVADYINHMNEHIRADTENVFSLRTKMRHENKRLIIDAMRNGPSQAAVYYHRKIMREPRYKPLWDLFERKKKWEVLSSTA